MEDLLNLTPHALNFYVPDPKGEKLATVNGKVGWYRQIATIESHGNLRAFPVGEGISGNSVGEIPVIMTPKSYKLSDYDTAGKSVIVSLMVVDLLMKDESIKHIYTVGGGALRDEQGRIFGVLGLIQHK